MTCFISAEPASCLKTNLPVLANSINNAGSSEAISIGTQVTYTCNDNTQAIPSTGSLLVACQNDGNLSPLPTNAECSKY